MTREAAILGTETVSVFAGKPSAVDAELIKRGLMRSLSDASGSSAIELRRVEKTWTPDPTVVERFVDVLLDACSQAVA